MDLEDILLGEISQIKIQCDITEMWNLKKLNFKQEEEWQFPGAGGVRDWGDVVEGTNSLLEDECVPEAKCTA